jgi:SAM-dependent methyltransferase
VSGASSRRDLFGAGLGRLASEARRAAEAGLSDVSAALRLDEQDTGVEPRKAAVRELFAAEYRRFGARVAPIANDVVEACAPEPGAELLDAGAGDGNVALAAGGRGASVTACDLSPEQVERGERRSREAGYEQRWLVADLEELPLADKSFDMVASALGTVYAPRPRHCLAELFRVLRPGGTLAIATWSSVGLMAEILELAGARVPALGTYRPPPQGIESPSRWGRYETIYRYLTGLATSFDCEHRTLTLSFESEAELLRFFLEPPGPLAPAADRLGGDERAELEERLLQLAAERAPDVELGYLLTVASR